MVLTISSGINHALNYHENFDQYGSFVKPSKIMPYQNHHAALMDLLNEMIELSC